MHKVSHILRLFQVCFFSSKTAAGARWYLSKKCKVIITKPKNKSCDKENSTWKHNHLTDATYLSKHTQKFMRPVQECMCTQSS